MIEENSLECPNCGEKTILKPLVYYGIFRNSRQPDGVCGNCGAFYWEHPSKPIPSIVFKSTEQKPKKLNWFEMSIKQEGRIKRGRKYPP